MHMSRHKNEVRQKAGMVICKKSGRTTNEKKKKEMKQNAITYVVAFAMGNDNKEQQT